MYIFALKGYKDLNNNQAYFILVIYFCYESQTAQFSSGTTLDVLTTQSTLEHEILQHSKAFDSCLQAGLVSGLSVYYPETCIGQLLMNVAFC